jgi:CHAT domain-containing protein
MLVGALGYYAYSYLSRGTPLERGLEALIEAASATRVTEARLSGGFKAAAYRAPSEGEGGLVGAKMDEARDLIADEAARGEDSNAQLALGRYLLLSNEGPAALGALKLAVARMPQSAHALNDLGVCLFQRGDYEEALDAFDDALRLDEDMPEALFNRGLCYRRLQLPIAARENWGRAADVETDPAWLEEVNRRRDEPGFPLKNESEEEKLEKVKKSLIEHANNNDVEAARALLHENLEAGLKARGVLSSAYLKACIEGDRAAAEKTLATMRIIAKLGEEKGDWMLSDLTDYLTALPESEKAVELNLFKEYADNSRADVLFASGEKGKKAAQRMSELYGLFRDRGNYVFQHRAASTLISYYLFRGPADRYMEFVRESHKLASQHRWPLALAGACNEMGVAHLKQGFYGLAINYGEEALDRYSKLGVKSQEAKVLQLLGFRYGYLGDIDKALPALRKSLDISITLSPLPREVIFDLLEMANFYRLRGNGKLALLYAEEAYKMAEGVISEGAEDREGFVKRYRVQSLSFMAAELARMNRLQEAEQHIKRSFELLNDQTLVERVISSQHVLSRAAEMALRAGDLQQALGHYSEAERQVSASQVDRQWLINILNGRAGVYRRMNLTAEARKDLDEAVRVIEEHRGQIKPEMRSQFLALSLSVIDQLISLEVGAGRWQDAYQISEKYRGRVLAEQMSQHPATLKQMQAELPEGLTVLQYSVTDQGTHIFLVSRSEFRYALSPVTTGELDPMVEDFLSDLKEKADPDQINSKGQALYEHLIAPVEKHLALESSLCIVPDKALHFLPFGALVNRSGQPLIRSYKPTHVPSSTVLLQCVKADREKSGGGAERFFAAGDPAFDREEFKSLLPLPKAAEEVEVASRYYFNPAAPRPVVLTGPDATESRVRENMMSAEVVHLAMHCLVDETASWLVALILAKDQAEQAGALAGPRAASDGKLCFDEVNGLSLPLTRLVILSACQSGIGQYYRGEGMVSIVRPFIAAKVPMVVASLWQVDSKDTAELMIEFHRQRKENNMSTGDALRAAQLHLVDQGKPPYSWAPFIAVGSDSRK